MPLPPGLASAVADPDFWHDFLYLGPQARRKRGEYPGIVNHVEPWSAEALEEWYFHVPDPPDDPFTRLCRVEFPVGPRYAVRLTVHPHLDHDLELVHPDGRVSQLGWIDCHNHEDALRCEELDLIGRCQALADPGLPHPGVPVVLLSIYAPLTASEDAGAAAAVLRSAARAAGIDPAAHEDRVRRLIDNRANRFVWRQSAEHDWWLEQDGNWLEDRLHPLHTIRDPGNDEYPFADMAAMVADGWRACRDVIRPGWRTTAVTGLAGAVADGGFDRLPVLADALEEAGCDHPAIRAHLRDGDPARGAWVVELLLGAEWGSVLRLCR